MGFQAFRSLFQAQITAASGRILQDQIALSPDFFVDISHEGEIVRARFAGGTLQLHEGGDSYVTLRAVVFKKEQVSPARDSRLRWMQSIVHCTHYVAGAGERAYLRPEDAPEITFVNRETIERSDEAYTEIPS